MSSRWGTLRKHPIPQRCQRRGCSNTFSQHVSGSKKRFCSRVCKNAWHKEAKGEIKTLPLGRERKLSMMRCRNGHERTEENTGVARGHRRCRDCHRAANLRYRQRQAA